MGRKRLAATAVVATVSILGAEAADTADKDDKNRNQIRDMRPSSIDAPYAPHSHIDTPEGIYYVDRSSISSPDAGSILDWDAPISQPRPRPWLHPALLNLYFFGPSSVGASSGS
jgi:hypothetical protein